MTETPIIISPFKRLLIRLGLKTSTRRHLGSNPYFPLENQNSPSFPYGEPGNYLRVRGSDMLLKITGFTREGDLWRIDFNRIYPL